MATKPDPKIKASTEKDTKDDRHEPVAENPDSGVAFVPNPMYQSGHVDTTGTGGDLAAQVDQASNIFAQARAGALRAASTAVRDGDDSTVIFADGPDRTREDGIAELHAAADAAEQARTEGVTPAAAQAGRAGQPVNPNSPIATGDIESSEHTPGGGATDAPISGGPPEHESPLASQNAAPAVHPNEESSSVGNEGEHHEQHEV